MHARLHGGPKTAVCGLCGLITRLFFTQLVTWSPAINSGEERADQAQPAPPPRPKPARGLTVSGQPLDGWPPPPPPSRSQLALPAVPTVRLPEPPMQAPQKVPRAACICTLCC